MQRYALIALLIYVIASDAWIAAEQATQSTSLTSDEIGEHLQIIASKGMRISDAQASNLEAKIKQQPDDAASRATLLGYYLKHLQTPPVLQKARREQVLWFIANRPEDSIGASSFCRLDTSLDADGYVQGRDIWFGKVQSFPQSPIVFSNAASFLKRDDPKQAESLLQRAKIIDPTNPDWPDQLANVYWSLARTISQPEQKQYAAQALSEYELAIKLSTHPDIHFYVATELPKAAFASGEMKKARQYASQLLIESLLHIDDWNYGNAIFSGNETLGRVALAEGDIPAAKFYLLAAAKTPGSPQLDSFGPDMILAKELLAKGEKETVLKYFDLCSNFWKMGTSQLTSWSETVKNGGTPDFGTNLRH